MPSAINPNPSIPATLFDPVSQLSNSHVGTLLAGLIEQPKKGKASATITQRLSAPNVLLNEIAQRNNGPLIAIR